ncbi:MAG: hypothetical protein JWN46_2684 [Acidimicrobiales bacterium]|nr:hypothetical protein [Acidimicrobiales bacterium]
MRLSVGLETIDHILADLDCGLRAAQCGGVRFRWRLEAGVAGPVGRFERDPRVHERLVVAMAALADDDVGRQVIDAAADSNAAAVASLVAHGVAQSLDG